MTVSTWLELCSNGGSVKLARSFFVYFLGLCKHCKVIKIFFDILPLFGPFIKLVLLFLRYINTSLPVLEKLSHPKGGFLILR